MSTIAETIVANTEPEAICRWLDGDPTNCPVCGEFVREGDDCEAEHFLNHEDQVRALVVTP